jgi:hypothetical protein
MQYPGNAYKFVSSVIMALALSACGGGGADKTDTASASGNAVTDDSSLASQGVTVNTTPITLADASSMKTYTYGATTSVYKTNSTSYRINRNASVVNYDVDWIANMYYEDNLGAPLYLESAAGNEQAWINFYTKKFVVGHRYRMSITYRTCSGCTGSMRAMVMAPNTIQNSGSTAIFATKKLTATTAAQTHTFDFVAHEVDVAQTTADFAFHVRIWLDANTKVYIDNMAIDEVDADVDVPAADIAGISTTRQVPISKQMFGLHVNELGSHNLNPKLGHDILRFWGGSSTSWADFQPNAAGEWVWDLKDKVGNLIYSRADYYMDYAVAAQKDVLLELGVTPKWAASADNLGCITAFGSAGCSPPRSTEEWKTYVRTVLARYKARYPVSPIKYLEVWNEFSVPQHFRGPASKLVELTCAAHDVIAEDAFKNDGIQVIAPSLAGYDHMAMSGLLDAQASATDTRGIKECADIISAHLYAPGYAPELVLPAGTANMWLQMKEHGIQTKPLWNTEGSMNCDLHCPANYVPSAAQLRGMLPRSFATMWANGISNFDYFLMEGGFEPWTALVGTPGNSATATGSLTPSGQGYLTAATWFKGGTLLAAYRSGTSNIRVQKIKQASGKIAYMVWSDVDTNYSKVSAPAGWRTLRVQRTDGTTTALPTPTTPFILKAREPALLTP